MILIVTTVQPHYQHKAAITHSTHTNCVGDLVHVLGRHPILSDKAVALDVDIEHIQMIVDGLHLVHFAQPHVDILCSIYQQRLELVL